MRAEKRTVNIPIVFEDDYILVIDKPSGVVVNQAETVIVPTVQEWIAKSGKIAPPTKDSDAANDFFARQGIVHRLDKDTSGLLVIAKTPEIFVSLQALFKERAVEKQYIALVHGNITLEQGEITAPVGRLPWNREHFGVIAGGRAATTSYTVTKRMRYQKEPLTLLSVYPKTGRTHQIRVHCKYMGHALVADPLYSGRKTYRRDLAFCPRLFLHAHTLSFVHPKTGNRCTFSAPLPPDLSAVIARIDK